MLDGVKALVTQDKLRKPKIKVLLISHNCKLTATKTFSAHS